MIAGLGGWLSDRLGRVMPDPFVLAVLLTFLTFALALAAGASPLEALASWQGDDGFWRLLRFGMQMCLILVTGHALAAAPIVRRGILALADRPNTAGQVYGLTALVSVATCLVNWGLGLIVGALFARDAVRSATGRGLRVHRPLAAAAGYSGLMAWHGGLSGSAPLKVTLPADLARLLGADLAGRVSAIGLDQTLLSPRNLGVCVALLVAAPLFFAALGGGEVESDPVSEPAPRTEGGAEAESTDRLWVERTPVLSGLLSLLMLAWFVSYAYDTGLSRLDPNALNLLFLAAGLLLHGSLSAYSRAVNEAVKGCGGIILQFPFYAGILGVMAGTGLVARFSSALVEVATPATLPALTFLSAGLVNLFVPSGGGQWALQGPIALEAALQHGVDPATLVMAVAYGDQWTNMLQPFWALPLLAITGVKARDMMGYTSAFMIVGAVVFLAALAL